MNDDELIQGIRGEGRFDGQASSAEEAKRLVRAALPHAVELPEAEAGKPYPNAPRGVKAWYQLHPAEADVGMPQPHVKYVDWTKGKKGRGGSWGHIFVPPAS